MSNETPDLFNSDFDHPDMVFQIGVAPRRIDILTQIDGVTWDEAAPHAVERTVNGMAFKILGLAALDLADRPLERSAVRKFSFREFAAFASTPAVP